MKKFSKYYQVIVIVIAILILFGAFVLPLMVGISKEMWLWALA